MRVALEFEDTGRAFKFQLEMTDFDFSVLWRDPGMTEARGA